MFKLMSAISLMGIFMSAQPAFSIDKKPATRSQLVFEIESIDARNATQDEQIEIAMGSTQ